MTEYTFGYIQFDGSSDLYPLQNKNLHNNWLKNNCALRIQNVWRKHNKKQKEKKRLELEFKNNMKYVPERFWSWFPY